MRDRVTISLNPLSTTRLTRLSKRKPCSSCAHTNSQPISYKSLGFVVMQFIARFNSTVTFGITCSFRIGRCPVRNHGIIFANVNILFTSGRVRNRFTTGSLDSKGCERSPEFGVLFTFLYLLLYLYLGSFFTKYRNNLDKNGINRSKSALCSRSCSEFIILHAIVSV